MKKIIISFSLVIFAIAAMAQGDPNTITETKTGEPLVNKKGLAILPQKGDLAIGVEAAPFLYFLGNMFNGNTDNTEPNLYFMDDYSTLFVKKMLEENKALRIRLEFTNDNYVDQNYVRDDNAFFLNPSSDAVVVDKRHYKYKSYYLALEIEKRRGHNRLQGYYGGGMGIYYSNEWQEYFYGNAQSELFPVPTSTNFGWGNINGNSRATRQNYGNTFGLGVGGFIGIEYFFTPSISLGGEVGLDMRFYKSGQSNTTWEQWNAISKTSEERTLLNGPGNRGFFTGVNNPKAGIFMMFYF